MRRSAARRVAYFGANGPYRKRGAARLRTTAPEATRTGGRQKPPPVRTGGGFRRLPVPVASGAPVRGQPSNLRVYTVRCTL